MRAGLIGVGLFVVAVAGCHTTETFTTTSTQDCSTDVSPKFSPIDTTIAVGASYTQHVALTSCSGTRTIVDSYMWSSNDPSKVAIDPQTGVVRGVAAGSATLTATGSFYGSFIGGTVTVH